MTIESIARVGIDVNDRTPTGLWPSDKAGIRADISINRNNV
ncbi:hypothetical protein LC087_03395 [Bacillus carboniphilus]|uniref:Uncharacterized protein n=1 Tax=Bacillus carboniphilus TaxID=86663 RepID=A0ABY9JWU8_9BACI|nr:hypothetical protein [Bacillus carboniphilus]WLR43253.1 hypothetical protein LC087_03395 [Bacillus carboniphilus]